MGVLVTPPRGWMAPFLGSPCFGPEFPPPKGWRQWWCLHATPSPGLHGFPWNLLCLPLTELLPGTDLTLEPLQPSLAAA